MCSVSSEVRSSLQEEILNKIVFYFFSGGMSVKHKMSVKRWELNTANVAPKAYKPQNVRNIQEIPTILPGKNKSSKKVKTQRKNKLKPLDLLNFTKVSLFQ